MASLLPGSSLPSFDPTSIPKVLASNPAEDFYNGIMSIVGGIGAVCTTILIILAVLAILWVLSKAGVGRQ